MMGRGKAVEACICVVLFLVAQCALAGDNYRLPPEHLSGVPMAQIFDYAIKNTSIVKNNRPVVWGAKTPDVGGDVYTIFYYPFSRDMKSEHDVTWYRRHHPDWIAYRCDRSTPAYLFNSSLVPLDISNPGVKKYFLNEVFIPALRQGYPAIGLDNLSLSNIGKACGVWRAGRWVDRYSRDVGDARYAADVLSYLQYMKGRIHQHGGAIAINFTLDLEKVPPSKNVIGSTDIFVDEAGFTNGCRGPGSGTHWQEKTDLVSTVAKQKVYISINRVCVGPAKLASSDINWIVANFLLVRGPRSYLAIVENNKYGRYVDIKPLAASIGAPVGSRRQIGGLFVRRYERGIVLVNPSLKSAAARLPDITGSSQGAQIEVPPLSGIVKYY
jgi:hypothetical protein